MASGDYLMTFGPRDCRRPAAWRVFGYSSGGTTAIVAGDTVTGATSTATADVVAVRVRSGSWAGGDAAGYMILTNQSGTFQSEDIDVGASSNLATITKDSFEGTAVSYAEESRAAVTLPDLTNAFTVFDGILPDQYAGSGGTMLIYYSMGGATTTKAVVLDLFIWPISVGDDLMTYAYDDDGNEDTVTESVPAAADELGSCTITIANAQMPAAAQRFRAILVRDTEASGDTAGEDLRIDSMHLTET